MQKNFLCGLWFAWGGLDLSLGNQYERDIGICFELLGDNTKMLLASGLGITLRGVGILHIIT